MKMTRVKALLTIAVGLLTVQAGSRIAAQATSQIASQTGSQTGSQAGSRTASHAVTTERKDLAPGILTRDEASAILPAKVFYKGQSASIQGRNSSGIRLKNGELVLATLVDTSGYSSTVQETYQAYLIAEVPVVLGGKTLAPGAYGFGFVAGEKMVVMDVGAHELLRVDTHRDTAAKRPTPLQILGEDGAPGKYRLYLGRTFVTLEPAS